MVVGTSLADDAGRATELLEGCNLMDVCDSNARPEEGHASDVDAGAEPRSDSTRENVDAAHPTNGRPQNVLQLTKRLAASLNEIQKVSLLQDLLASVTLPHCVSLQVATFLHRGCPPDCADFTRWLPPETTLRIFAFLDPVSLARCAQVSRGWYRLANDPSLWRRLCSLPAWRLSPEGERQQLAGCSVIEQACRARRGYGSAHGRRRGERPGLSDDGPGQSSGGAESGRELAVAPRRHTLPKEQEVSVDWRAAFIERFRLHRNWMTGRCHVRTFAMNQALETEHGGVTCVDFDERRIVVGFCNNGRVQIWRRATNATWSVQKVVCHSGSVRCLQLLGNDLVTGSSDHTIKLWRLSLEEDWSGMVCKLTLLGHTMLVRCIQMNDSIVVSGSYDHTLKLWSLKTGECKKTFYGHTGEIWSLQFDDEKIVSSSSDKTIRIWKFDGTCVQELHGHVKGVACIAFAGNRLVSGSHDCTLRFWNLQTGTCEITVDWTAGEGHKDVVRCVSTDGRRVLSASDDKAIKVWDLYTGKRLHTLCGHQDGVTCLQFNDQVIVSGSFDETVRLWDFSVC